MHIQSTLHQMPHKCSVPHPCALFLAHGWETTNLNRPSMRSRILYLDMIRILGTIFAGLLGLAFGSFLNVCLSRWPAGESVVKPRSHCRQCNRTLTWWENVPLISWLALRGRCRT